MMRYAGWIFIVAVIISLFFMTLSGNAQTIEPEWGTEFTTCKSISATAFSPYDSAITWVNYGMGWIYRSNGGFSFNANVDLPTGAKVWNMYANVVDDSADYGIFVRFVECPTDESTNCIFYPTDNSFTTTGSPGYQRLHKNLSGENIIIDNLHNSYFVIVYLNANDSSNRFRSVQVCYTLQVSPAPAFATFSDVPVGHWAHQYVEALYASGITEGYDDGTFRPGKPVLRGQMAAFLAKALGLHWPR
jgi:hypothetical protein